MIDAKRTPDPSTYQGLRREITKLEYIIAELQPGELMFPIFMNEFYKSTIHTIDIAKGIIVDEENRTLPPAIKEIYKHIHKEPPVLFHQRLTYKRLVEIKEFLISATHYVK